MRDIMLFLKDLSDSYQFEIMNKHLVNRMQLVIDDYMYVNYPLLPNITPEKYVWVEYDPTQHSSINVRTNTKLEQLIEQYYPEKMI